MNAKKRLIEPRTMIYILIVVLIVAGIAYFALTYEPDDVLTVTQVNAQSNNLIGETIKVEGIYYFEDEPILSSNYESDANPVLTDTLSLNISQLDNETNLVEDQQYLATGLLTENQFGFIELKVEEIKQK